jgi:hypothetical protein
MDTPTPKEVVGSGAIVEGADLVSAKASVSSAAKTGFVALLDVLGFRGLITGTEGGNWVTEYLSIVDFNLGLSEVEAVIFSDSIVLTKDGDDAESLHAICWACALLMYFLLESNTPVRGAIAHGSFYRSQFGKSTFVAGRPIVEAYDYETKQDWVGVMLAPSALRAPHGIDWNMVGYEGFNPHDAHKDMKEHIKWRALVQRHRKIPVHSASHGRDTLDGFAIVPCLATTVGDIPISLRKVVGWLDALKLNAPTPEDQRKYAGALEWLNALLEQWAPRASNYANYKP